MPVEPDADERWLMPAYPQKPKTAAGQYLVKYGNCQMCVATIHDNDFMLILISAEQELVLCCFRCHKWSHWRLGKHTRIPADAIGQMQLLARGALTVEERPVRDDVDFRSNIHRIR